MNAFSGTRWLSRDFSQLGVGFLCEHCRVDHCSPSPHNTIFGLTVSLFEYYQHVLLFGCCARFASSIYLYKTFRGARLLESKSENHMNETTSVTLSSVYAHCSVTVVLAVRSGPETFICRSHRREETQFTTQKKSRNPTRFKTTRAQNAKSHVESDYIYVYIYILEVLLSHIHSASRFYSRSDYKKCILKVYLPIYKRVKLCEFRKEIFASHRKTVQSDTLSTLSLNYSVENQYIIHQSITH